MWWRSLSYAVAEQRQNGRMFQPFDPKNWFLFLQQGRVSSKRRQRIDYLGRLWSRGSTASEGFGHL